LSASLLHTSPLSYGVTPSCGDNTGPRGVTSRHFMRRVSSHLSRNSGTRPRAYDRNCISKDFPDVRLVHARFVLIPSRGALGDPVAICLAGNFSGVLQTFGISHRFETSAVDALRFCDAVRVPPCDAHNDNILIRKCSFRRWIRYVEVGSSCASTIDRQVYRDRSEAVASR